jgi:hypothetical protein
VSLTLALVYLLSPIAPVSSQTSKNGNVTSVQVANNTTPVQIAPGSGRLLVGMEAYSVDTSTTWVKLYNAGAAASVTCGQASPVPLARYLIVGQTTGAGYITSNVPPDIYASGIVACFTTGYADTDTTAPAASKFVVNFHWQ